MLLVLFQQAFINAQPCSYVPPFKLYPQSGSKMGIVGLMSYAATDGLSSARVSVIMEVADAPQTSLKIHMPLVPTPGSLAFKAFHTGFFLHMKRIYFYQALAYSADLLTERTIVYAKVVCL